MGRSVARPAVAGAQAARVTAARARVGFRRRVAAVRRRPAAVGVQAVRVTAARSRGGCRRRVAIARRRSG